MAVAATHQREDLSVSAHVGSVPNDASHRRFSGENPALRFLLVPQHARPTERCGYPEVPVGPGRCRAELPTDRLLSSPTRHGYDEPDAACQRG